MVLRKKLRGNLGIESIGVSTNEGSNRVPYK